MRLINVHNLKRSLDCLCNCLHKLYNINCGGCCYVAYLIAQHLDKLKIKYSFIIYYSGKRDINNIKQDIFNLNTPNCITGKQTCEHYCISIIGGGIVNRGCTSYLRKCTINNITSGHIKWIYLNGRWNKTCNRDNYRYIEDIINSFFSKYEKNNLSSY